MAFSVTLCLVALSWGLLLNQKLSHLLDWMAPNFRDPPNLIHYSDGVTGTFGHAWHFTWLLGI